MLVFCDRNLDHTSDVVRDHPWTTSETDPASRFHDFREKPELIRTALEDFIPFGAWPAIDRFYRLVEWLNGADSTLESNDCGFRGPRPNDNARFAGALKCSGRLMLFYRGLRQNLHEPACQWLSDSIAQCLWQTDAGFVGAAIGISRLPTRFVELPLDDSGDEESRIGWILMISFWAFGDADEQVFGNLDRLFVNLTAAMRETSQAIKARIASG
ncbi:MAG TPA: hypothetical protein VG326_11460 [Tepidisphaeraceae bacterium]|jgi:hypothetical protein|nr:hypothetical protein [Tepidisphaeraceae bacterium]